MGTAVKIMPIMPISTAIARSLNTTMMLSGASRSTFIFILSPYCHLVMLNEL